MSMPRVPRFVGIPTWVLFSFLTGCGAADGASVSPADEPADDEVAETSDALRVANGDSVAVATWFSCALLEGGVVKCWGTNDHGQLGAGDAVNRGDTAASMGNALRTVNLGTGRTAKQIRAGNLHACAILDNDQIKCWGFNANGQLGTGDRLDRGTSPAGMGDNLPQVDLGIGRRAKAVAVGVRHTCAILDTDQVKCWGFNNAGALGIGDAIQRALPGDLGDNLPVVNLGTGRSAKAIAAGADFSCAILDTNQLKCWGQNVSGQLGQGHTTNLGMTADQMGDNLPPIDLGPGRTLKSMALTQWSACAILDNDQLKCWGNNQFGQLGRGTTDHVGDDPNEMGDALPAVNLGQDRRAIAIAARGQTVCALLDTNLIKCWGNNDWGQLGQGDLDARGDQPDEMGDQLPPVLLGTNQTALGMSVGLSNVCATLGTRLVKCWGSNSGGVLGIGSADPSPRGDAPGELGDALPRVNLGSKGIKAVTTGINFTCAVLNNNGVKCWGQNSVGQLGLGDTVTRGDGPNEMGGTLPALQFGTGLTVRQISSGFSSSCAVFTNNRMKCWGFNEGGELGVGHRSAMGDGAGEMGDNLPFVNLGTGRTIKAVAMGGGSACAILDNNGVKCWGRNESGQLGLGDFHNRGDDAAEMGDDLPFVDLGTGRTAKKISVGTNHACAVLDTNQVKCWGWNSTAQLGLGDMQNRGDAPGEMGDALPAIDLGTGRTAKDVSAGAFHSCVWLDSNLIKCWGSNVFGSVGVGVADIVGDAPGEMGDALPTVRLGLGRSVKSVATSIFGTCAVLDTGLVKCWGANDNGRLGLGDVRARGASAGDMGDGLPTVFLGVGRSVVSVAASHHACAVLTTGELKCWGRNTSGALGLGDVADRGDSRAESTSGYDAVDLGLE